MEIALYRPEIPPNTGNIARLSVCTGSRLHIIGKPSFSMDEAAVRRAGLDYWHEVDLHLHEEWDAFLEYVARRSRETGGRRVILISKFGRKSHSEHQFRGDEILVFGRESSGLPEHIVQSVLLEDPERILRIPVRDLCRSLNLSNSVAILIYEALRQLDFPGLDKAYEGSKIDQ